MGLLNSVQNRISSCFEESDSLPGPSTYLMIDQDQKHIRRENWYRLRSSPCFDPNKLVFVYPEYSQDMSAMEHNWEQIKLGAGHSFRDINDVILPNLKYMIRKGLPMSKMRPYLIDVFQLNDKSNTKQDDYNRSLTEAFRGKVPEEFTFVPLFGIQADSLQEALKVYFLNQEGIKTLSRVLWTLHKTKHIQYCPTIVHVASIMAMFLDPWEIYSALTFMVEDSINMHLKNEDSLRWHFSLNQTQINRLSKSFFESVSQISRSFQSVVQHLYAYDIDQERLFKELTVDLFLRHLPFPFVFKIFCAFINEGVKIFFRIIYALFKTYKEHILKCQTTEKILSVIFERSVQLTRKQINEIVKVGYRLPLPGPYRNLSAYQDSGNSSNSQQIYYFPTLTGTSEIMDSKHLELLWSFLPVIYKQDDPKMVFPSEHFGYSLAGFLEAIKPHEDKPIFLVIQDNQGDIFGVFFLQKLTSNIDVNYTSTSDTFVFTLEPEACEYTSTGYNTQYCQIEESFICFGNGKTGPALQIDKELWKGYSNDCETFNSKRLHRGSESQFKVSLLQCYVLQ